MTKQTIDSDLSLAILGLLAARPMSGYDLRKVFLTTAIKAFSASPGAIYPALRRLEKDGLIEGAVERKHTLRPRMVFTLARRGRAALVETLTRPVSREDVIRGLDGLVLRFAFMSGIIGHDAILEFFSALTREMEGYLGELEAEFRASASGLSVTGRAALELGVEGHRMTARWARRTLAELKRNHPSKGERR